MTEDLENREHSPLKKLKELLITHGDNPPVDEFILLCHESLQYLNLEQKSKQFLQPFQNQTRRLTLTGLLSEGTIALNDEIVVSSDELQNLNIFLQKNFVKIQYEATSNKGYKHTFFTFEDLLNYENPDHRKIDSLTIIAVDDEEPENSLRIRLGPHRFAGGDNGSITLHFFNIGKLDHIELELLRRIRQMRPWYHWLTKTPLTVLLAVITALYVYFDFDPSYSLWYFIGIILSIGIGIFIDFHKSYLFPIIFFRIGMQERVFKRKELIANILLVVVGLGIVVGLIVNYLSAKMHITN